MINSCWNRLRAQARRRNRQGPEWSLETAELAQAVALKPPLTSRLLYMGTRMSMATQIRPQILRDFAEKISGKLRPNSAP
jgi:hypothetical protein